MNKKALSILVFSVISFLVQAQQDPQFSNYMFVNQSFNPGYSGSQEKIYATVLRRDQYLKFEGAPATTNALVNMPFKLFGKNHGAGIAFSNESIGFFSNNMLKLSYAYRASLGGGTLGFGVAGGFFQHTFDDSQLLPPNENSTYGAPNDNGIPAAKEENVFKADIDAGVFYQGEDLYLGVSATHINTPTINYGEKSGNASGAQLPHVLHYYVTAGYNFLLSNPAFEISPSFLLKTDGASSQIDLNGILTYNKRIWGGVSFRITELVFLGGIELANNLRLGLGYDVTLSRLIKYNTGSLEFLINYTFEINRDKIPQHYKSIRFL